MSNKTGLYENHILRGIQDALETKAHGKELIEIARYAREDQKLLRAVRRIVEDR